MDNLFLRHSILNTIKANSDIGDNPAFNNFESNPAYRKVVLEGKEVATHVIDSGNTDNLPKRYFIPKPPVEFKAGDIVETDDYGRWICTTINNSLGYNKGFFMPITKDIKWIDEEDNLRTTPAIITAKTLYTTGVKDESVFEIPNGMIGILIPKNEITESIERDMHFVFNKSRYKVTFYDELTIKGIVSLICEEENIAKTDDRENEIADRYRPDGTDRLKEDIPIDPVDPDPEEIILSIEGKDRLFFGETYKYIGKGTKENKIEFSVIKGKHLIDILDTGQSWCTIKAKDGYQGGKFTLRMNLVEDTSVYVDKEITVSY